MDRDYSVYVLGGTRFSFFFFFVFSSTRGSTGDRSYCSYCAVTVHALFRSVYHFSAIFSLKMGPTALFTHLKIILLQCFQFSTKISCIQMDPKHFFQLLMWKLSFYMHLICCFSSKLIKIKNDKNEFVSWSCAGPAQDA